MQSIKSKLFLIIILLIPLTTLSNTVLKSNTEVMVLESSGNPYIIEENLTIGSGKKLTINAGAVLLFKPFTGIIVQDGILEVNGSLEKPVIFTSINDSAYNQEAKELPNPFDWNGILISPDAQKVKFSNFILAYSVYGIKSQKKDFIINNGVFAKNGQFSVTVKDSIKSVVDNVSFSFGVKEKTLSKAVKPIALSTGFTGIAGLGVAGSSLIAKTIFASKYNQAKTQDLMDTYVSKQETALRVSLISGITSVVLISSGTVLYLHDINSKRKIKIAMSPILGNCNGIALNVKF